VGEVRKYTVGDPFFTALEAWSKDEASSLGPRQIELHFACPKDMRDTGRPEDESGGWWRANKLKRSCIEYDEAAVWAFIDRTEGVHTRISSRRAGRRRTLGQTELILEWAAIGTTLVETVLRATPKCRRRRLTLLDRASPTAHAAMHRSPGISGARI